MEEEEVTTAPTEDYVPKTPYAKGHEEKGWIYTGRSVDGKYQYGHMQSGRLEENDVPPEKYFSYLKETTREGSPEQKAFNEKGRRSPPPTGIAARLKAKKEQNAKIRAALAKNKKYQEAKAAIEKQAEAQGQVKKQPTAQAKPMKQQITEVVQSNLSPEEKKKQLDALKVSPGTLSTVKTAPVPEHLLTGEPGVEDPQLWPIRKDESPLTKFFGGDEEIKTETMQAEAEEDLAYEQGPPQGTQFIRGAKVSGGVNPDTGIAYEPFHEPVNTPASKAVLQMQQDYKRETGRELYITSGQRSVEDNMRQHGMNDTPANRKIAARGQHVHGKAYDFYMAPPADGPSVTHEGRKYLSGHKLTDEWAWLNANAANYGFVNTAPIDKNSGRKEWWHWEFTGEGGAAELPSKADIAEIEAAGGKGERMSPPRFYPPGKEPTGTPSDYLLADNLKGALATVNQKFADGEFEASEHETVLERKGMVDEISTDLQNSLVTQYDDTLALQKQQNDTARLIAQNKADLADKEIAVLQSEEVVNWKSAQLRDQWNQEALDQGYGRLKEVNAEIEAIKKKSVSPWDMFGAYKVNEKTGEEEWDWGKASFTFVSGMALLANFAATIGSATSKKGKQIPFLVYGMLNDAIRADTQAQIASINRDYKAIDKKRAGYKDIMGVVQDQRAFVEQTRLDKINGIRDALRVERARAKSSELKQAIDELDAKFKLDATNAKVKRDSSILDVAGKNATTAISALNSHEREQNNRLSIIINGLAQAGKLKAKEGKLNKAQQLRLNDAQKRLVMAQEVEKLWKRSGQANITKGLHRFTPQAIVDAIQYIKDVGLDDADPARWAALDDIEKLYVIRETWAPQLAKSMGDVGNLAEQEQKRAMNQLPMWDASPKGWWKVLRFKQRVMLASSKEYQLLDDAQKLFLRTKVLAQKDDLKGLKEQVRIQKEFLDRIGAGAVTDGSMEFSTARSREEELRKKYNRPRGSSPRSQGLKGVAGLQDVQSPPPISGNPGNISRPGRTEGEALDY